MKAKLKLNLGIKPASQAAVSAFAQQAEVEGAREGYAYFEFRMLSADVVIGSGTWKSSEFPSAVLKAALPLYVNKTVYKNHYMSVGNECGLITEAAFDTGGKRGGQTVPPGVNGIIRIYEKENPMLVRRIMDGEIKSVSTTLEYTYEHSHEFEDEWDFYYMLGDKIDGEEVRMIASEIHEVYEVSFVSVGADGFANQIDRSKDPEGYLSHIWEHGVISENQFNQFNKTMKKEDQDKLAKLEASLAEKEGRISELNQVVESNAAVLEAEKEKVKALQTEKAAIQKENEGLRNNAEYGMTLKKQHVDYAYKQYCKATGTDAPENPEDDPMFLVLQNASFDHLSKMVIGWGGKIMSDFSEPTCTNCGHKGFTFRKSGKPDDKPRDSGHATASEDQISVEELENISN